MPTLDTQEGQKEFATRVTALVQEFGGRAATWIVTDELATPLAFGVVGTTPDGARELLCRAVSISYESDLGSVYEHNVDGIRLS